MKKISFLIMTIMAGVSALMAKTSLTMTLNIDHADRVTVKYMDLNYNTVEVTDLHDGDNEFTIEVGDWSKSVDIIAKEGYGLASCTYQNPDSETASESPITYMSSSYFDASADPSTNGAVWTVKTFDFAEMRTASVQTTVDDASRVIIKRPASNTEVKVENGINNITFIPAEGENTNESVFIIASTEWDKPLYQILLNGVPVDINTADDEGISLKDGDKLDIKANYPDIDIPVKFTYSETARGVVSGIEVDGKNVDFNGDELIVKAGSKVQFSYDEERYQVNEIQINGEKPEYLWTPVSLGIVASETTVAIDADKLETFKISVDINDASLLKLQAFKTESIYYGGMEIELYTGLNENVEIPVNRPYFSVTPKTRASLKQLFVNDEEIKQRTETDYYGSTYEEWPFPLTFKDGDKVKLIGNGPQRDKQAVVYVDAIPQGSFAFDFNINGYVPQLKAGYNFVAFDSNPDDKIGDLPFNFMLNYTPMQSWLYLNGESVEAAAHSDYADSYVLKEVADKSVIKLFTLEEPQPLAVTLKTTGISNDNVSMSTDYVTPTSDFSAPIKVLPGTFVSLKFNTTEKMTVTANGKELTPDEAGEYTLTATEPLEISATQTVGVMTANADADATF
ncbi:MAG: hypothetical protein NC548_65090, partial [Lachnospiraceae bacterium]|nr:hypothetical protein [Lachnospiraceae bacterium]